MISKEQMIPVLLKALPGLQEDWDSFLAEWSDPTDWPESGIPIYVFLTDVSRHLIKLLENEEFSELQSAFSIIEAWHLDGDAYVAEAASAGLLESIQNPNLHTTTSPVQFEPFLGEKSKVNWIDLYSYWKDRPNES